MNRYKTGKPLVIGVGELLWDLLPAGRQLGGAPANFAYHAQGLGADVLVVSMVGKDEAGRDILERCRALGLATVCIGIDPSTPTGTVNVAVDADGKPAYTIHENVAWDHIHADLEVLSRVKSAAAVCFGSLAQRSPQSRASIRAVIAAAPADALRVFDVNLRAAFWSKEVVLESLQLASVCKLNDEEMAVLSGMLGLVGCEEEQMRELATRYRLHAVALTKGAEGSVLLVRDELVARPASCVDVIDTVGAGDSYTAALTLGLIAGAAPASILESAHHLADFVCTQTGATPPLPRADGFPEALNHSAAQACR